MLCKDKFVHVCKYYMNLLLCQSIGLKINSFFLNLKSLISLFPKLYVLAIYGTILSLTNVPVFAQTVNVPVLRDGIIISNGTTKGTIGRVAYNVIEQTDTQIGNITKTYALNRIDSSRIRIGIGDEIAFSGTIEVPEESNLSWIRVDIYTTDTEQPYTAGAEYYREDNRKTNSFDLSALPKMLVGEPIGRSELCFEAGKEYILMFSAGASAGGAFEDRDEAIDDIQGPAIILTIKHDPQNCIHPHDRYVYLQHSSGEMRSMSYGDPYTHQLEPLMERYCGLCDSFLGNIWGQGTTREHAYSEFGTCVACGYSPLMTPEEDVDYIISIPASVTMNKADGMTIRLDAIEAGNTITILPKSANNGKLRMGENEIPYSYDINMVFSQAGEQTLNIVINPTDAIGLPPGTYTDTLTFDVSVERASK